MILARTLVTAAVLAVLLLRGAAAHVAPYSVAIDVSLAWTIVVSVPVALGILQFQPSQTVSRLVRDRILEWHLVPAALAVIALSLESPGWVAAGLGAPWILFTATVALLGILSTSTFRGCWRIEERGVDVACAYLAVGGVWFAATLLGVPLMGFHEPIVRLTAVHFHVASFCLVLVSVELTRRVVSRGSSRRALLRLALTAHVLSPTVVAAGITWSRSVEALGAGSLVLSWLVIIALSVHDGIFLRMSRRSAALMAVSGLLLVTTLMMALSYSLFRLPAIPHMALVHGLLNALIVIPCALAALRLCPEPLRDSDDGELLEALTQTRVSAEGLRVLPLLREQAELPLGTVSEEEFQRAGDLLLSYGVYGERCMESYAPFKEDARRPQPGDRIVQRMHLLLWGKTPILTLPSLVEVNYVEDTAHVKGLGYATTQFHVGVGVWRAELLRSDAGACTLKIESRSRPRGLLLITTPLFRYFQRRARNEAMTRVQETIRTKN